MAARTDRRLRPGDVRLDPSRIQLVIDTNVTMDLYAPGIVEMMATAVGRESRSAKTVWRRRRVRDALVLGMHLNSIQAQTYQCRSEGLRLIPSKVPPGDHDSEGYRHVMLMTWFVKHRLLPSWQDLGPRGQVDLRGTSVDDHLLDWAKEHRKILITNEQNTPSGIVGDPKRLRDKAAAVGVRALTAGEYLAEKRVDADAHIAAFLRRYDEEWPRYLKGRKGPNLHALHTDLAHLLAFLNYVLWGERPGYPPLEV